MKLYLDKGTRRQLSVLFRKIPDFVTRISAAVAYTHDATLVDLCASRGIELDWWGLFSSEGSTDFQVIEKAISSPNIRFYPFAEFFHPKVIWFHEYGLYVGSHNMTKSALERNVEAGVFLDESELQGEHRTRLDEYFSYLRENSIPATVDDIDRLKGFRELMQDDQDKRDEITFRMDEQFHDQFSHFFHLKPGVQDYERTSNDRSKKLILVFRSVKFFGSFCSRMT